MSQSGQGFVIDTFNLSESTYPDFEKELAQFIDAHKGYQITAANPTHGSRSEATVTVVLLQRTARVRRGRPIEQAPVMQPAQTIEKLAAEELPQRPDGQQESAADGPPLARVELEAAPGDHAVQVRVQRELARPGVEHRSDAELDAQPAVGHLEQALAGGLEERRRGVVPRSRLRTTVEPGSGERTRKCSS